MALGRANEERGHVEAAELDELALEALEFGRALRGRRPHLGSLHGARRGHGGLRPQRDGTDYYVRVVLETRVSSQGLDFFFFNNKSPMCSRSIGGLNKTAASSLSRDRPHSLETRLRRGLFAKFTSE